jgi:hypothetical protein
VEQRFVSQYPKQLRFAARVVFTAAAIALSATALSFGTSDQLLGVGLLSLLAPILINFLLRRANGKSAGYGALTVSHGISARETAEIDSAAIWGARVYAVGINAIAILLIWRY